jgi:hypothetical protein
MANNSSKSQERVNSDYEIQRGIDRRAQEELRRQAEASRR